MICFSLVCSLFGLQCDLRCKSKRKAEHTNLRIDLAVASAKSDPQFFVFFSFFAPNRKVAGKTLASAKSDPPFFVFFFLFLHLIEK